ncbi:Transglutaminase-like superfamily protein [Anatilimnocola aggregata]|uniref:Transglutaminase-like superfamily protein n=1 Tax=Anatilimnocola aggregata TaxID=2528021 RepID=A0A517YKU9_9BACT|nr:transglutaminase family protein [Anatilimnocola aggregata]QDU30834.1 Transglutaminase-like superfamily protein [Anatilimnocola aggregata]
MRFLVSGHLEYTVAFPSTLILNIHAQRNSGQTILDEKFEVTPYVKFEEFVLENASSRFVRLETGKKKALTIDYHATVECTHEVISASKLDFTPVAEMDRKAIPYLFPSRYCQSDRLGRLAWDLFGKIPNPYEKVIAIVDWIHANVEYLRGSTNSETSAYDTVTQRTGVCRDFAHLGISLCRALNIPSRYFSGYAYHLQPPDFHACFESYIGGRWLVFDATRLAPLNGLVRIGTGRDAADAAVASCFGRVELVSMQVDCQLAPDQKFTPLERKQLGRKGISLEAHSNVTPTN